MPVPGSGGDLSVKAVKDELTTITEEVARKRGVDPTKLSYSDVDGNEPGGREGCTYFNPDGSPSCIIGHWLDHRYSLNLQDLINEDFHHGDINSAGFGDLIQPLLPDLPEEVESFLTNVQTVQDDGEPWAYAISHAWETHHEEYLDEDEEDAF